MQLPFQAFDPFAEQVVYKDRYDRLRDLDGACVKLMQDCSERNVKAGLPKDQVVGIHRRLGIHRYFNLSSAYQGAMEHALGLLTQDWRVATVEETLDRKASDSEEAVKILRERADIAPMAQGMAASSLFQSAAKAAMMAQHEAERAAQLRAECQAAEMKKVEEAKEAQAKAISAGEKKATKKD